MKQNTIIVIAVMIIAAVITFFLFRGCNSAKPDIIAAVDSVQYWKNERDQVVASIKQREQDYNKISQALKDTIEKLHHTNFNLVNQVAVLLLKGDLKIPATSTPEIVYKKDSTPCNCSLISQITQPYSNRWYTAIDYINLEHPDSSNLYLTTSDSIYFVEKIVKEGGLFNRQKYLQVDVINRNPYNIIEGLTVYRRPIPKQKKIGIGIQFGTTITNNLNPKPYVGIGISYNLIRL